ncbi:ABC transporter substrate-binding protein [Mycobacterium sp. C31M]
MTALDRRTLLKLALAGSVATVSAACTSAVQQARQGDGGITLGMLSDLDPKAIFSQSITSMAIGRLVFDTLTTYDLRTMQPRPLVAAGWEIRDGGRTVEVRLRPDVVFHSGRPLTSADVAYSISNLAKDSAGSQLQATAKVVTAVNTSDPHTAVLSLAHPLTNLFDLFEFMLLTDSESESELLAGNAFVGTGPFRFDFWERGQGSRWVRNDDYWGGAATIPSVRLVRQGEPLASLWASQSNVVRDVIGNVVRMFGDNSLFEVTREGVYDVAYYVGVNVEDPYLSDRAVRQAIAHAVDRDRIAADVFAGNAIAGSAPWSPSSPAFSEQAQNRYRHNPDRARDLLAAAAGPPPAPLLLSYGTGLAPAPTIAAIIQNNLAEVGIPVTIDPREQAGFSTFLKSPERQLWINPHGFGQSVPTTLATGAAPFKPKGNLSGFNSPAYTEAVDRMSRLADPRSPAALEVYRTYTELLADEQFVINLVATDFVTISSRRVRGLSWNLYKYLVADRTQVSSG